MVLGIMRFGTTTSEATAFALLDRWAEAGGRWLDTANCYAYWSSPSGHGGQSEQVLGRWLEANPGVRPQIAIATKVGCEAVPPEKNPAGTEGLAGPVVKQGLRDSLERMHTDYVDLYWAHRDDHVVPQGETVAAFTELVAGGSARRWGYSNAALWRVERARSIAAVSGQATPTALQLRYSYLQPRPFVRDHIHDHRFGWVDDQTLDYVDHNPEVEIWAYTPQMEGAYDRPERPINPAFDHPGSTKRLEALTRVAADLGWSRGQVVLAWMTGAPTPVAPIVGVSSLAQLEAAITATSTPLPAELQQSLDQPW
jgi:aryl-alcohol dehydrogenase-like predicted oxidoreductase